ncbi:MAG: TerD family protein [Methylococcales bacterium]|jgi:hypothetical protein|nr:TerD family protein [Methylococcales bacterium]MBT7445458.1 TerD family protein [Methylococcales bacterium]
MNKIEISIRKLNAIVISPVNGVEGDEHNQAMVMTLNAEMMKFGFILSESVVKLMCAWDVATISQYYDHILPVVQQLKGADVHYQPMYPNFPGQVIAAAELELYINAVVHYWSCGQWLPNYRKLPRKLRFEAVKYIEIGIANESDFEALMVRLITANESLSEQDKAIVKWYYKTYPNALNLVSADDIPFKENKCVVAAILVELKQPIDGYVNTATDVLRVATALSSGDVSLAGNTAFKSLSRPVRRQLISLLEEVINEEDIRRHKNKWVKLFHNLHVGDYSAKVYKIAKKARNNLRMDSFNGKVECYLCEKQVDQVVALLAARPGEFARRLDEVLRLSSEVSHQMQVVERFVSVASHVPTRVQLQLLGHFQHRHVASSHKIVFPKGSTQKGVVVRKEVKALNREVTRKIVVGIEKCLLNRFAKLAPLGPVWVDPALLQCPVPTQQRSASAGLFEVARGTRLPLGNKETLRFFIYWVGADIDLSATFHAEDFSLLEHVSYTNLKSDGYNAYHSGDITSAPNGASEFIDINLAGLADKGVRYIAMNVLVYSGPLFKDHETCYAGWMMRDKPNSNEVFEPKTVEQKIDVRSQSRNVIPVVFDVQDKQVIWVDLAMAKRVHWRGNNVESNHASIEEKLEAIVFHHKVSLGQLFALHAKARGWRVQEAAMADQVFSMGAGVTPFNIDVINADYISD